VIRFVACLSLVACGPGPYPVYDPPRPPTPWPVPNGWRSEVIPFPLEFAPALPHKGLEEIRFAPGFFDPAAPGYWSYAFVWRLEGYPKFDAPTLAAELTTYFRGLIDAVDENHEIADHDAIVAHAEGTSVRVTLTAHIYDAFKTKQPLDLRGTASEHICKAGSLWIFVLAPERSSMRAELDALATQATCDQPLPPSPPK
jgi:hypothetical protein